jgi:RHS repeat-associated protein
LETHCRIKIHFDLHPILWPLISSQFRGLLGTTTSSTSFNDANSVNYDNCLDARGIEGIITIPASGSASLNWLMYDGHGNVVRTVDTRFGLSAYQWRGVWGERQTSTLQTGRGYCANLGHQEDETGLVYMRARYYEPTTGRFISEDPARDGVNWYLYADGNPVGRVDASGRDSVDNVSAFFFILGMVFASAAILGMMESKARIAELGG